MSYIDNWDLNRTAYIYGRTETNDSMGSYTFTNTLKKQIRCALWQSGAFESVTNDRIRNPSSYILACQPDNSFAADDIVVIGTIEYRITRPDNVLNTDEIMIIGMELNG